MQTLFRDYIKHNSPIFPEVYELKICKSTSLPFDAVKKHQTKALLDSKKFGFFHKLTDPPIFYGGKMRFNLPRPFDCMWLIGVKAFVVVWFYKPRQPKIFIKIPIQNFIDLEGKSVRKSMTEEMALSIGTPFLIKKYDNRK